MKAYLGRHNTWYYTAHVLEPSAETVEVKIGENIN
jgi:hypothetical protein